MSAPTLNISSAAVVDEAPPSSEVTQSKAESPDIDISSFSEHFDTGPAESSEVKSTTPAEVKPAEPSIEPKDPLATQEPTVTSDEPTVPVEQKPVEPVKPIAPAAPVKPAVPATPLEKKSTQPIIGGGRDYTGLDEKEIALCKRMSNDAYAYVRPILSERKAHAQALAAKDAELAQLKTGKEIIPDSYYEHPDAYKLTREYQDSLQTVQGAQAIEEHWRKQLIAVENGQDWVELYKDPTSGQFKLSEPKANDGTAKATIWENLQFARDQHRQEAEKLHSAKSTFVERSNKVKDFVSREMEDAYFPFYKTENLNTPAFAEDKKIIDAVLKAMPPELSGNVLKTSVAKAYAFVIRTHKEKQALEKKLSTYEIKASDKTKAQPTVSSTSAPTTQSQGVTIDAFEAELGD